MDLRRLCLPAFAATALAACGDGGTTPPDDSVAQITVSPSTASLDQLDATQQFTAQAVNEDGDPVMGVTFAWESSAPMVATVNETTGLATAVGDGTAMITAEAEGVRGQAALTVEIAGLQVSTTALNNGRLTLPYGDALEARGGAGGYSFSVASGSLPAGLTLEPGGAITGTPTQIQTASFTVRVTDSANETAQRQLSVTVCDAPEPFAVGESVALRPPAPGQCGVFLPSGPGHRYRVALIRTNTTESASDVATLDLVLDAVGEGAALHPPVAAATTPAEARLSLPAEPLRRYRDVATATRARHEELRRQESVLLRTLGADGVLPDHRSARFPVLAQSQPLPQKLRIDPTTPQACSPAGEEATALKIAENDLMGIYQDSTQNASADTRVTLAEARALLDFYADYGKTVMDEFFGGVQDVNGDGKVVVFVTPEVDGDVAAFVWSGDFFTTEECPASNAMEIVFFNQAIVAALDDPDTPAQGLETLAHEMKHVSSLYQRVLRSQEMGSSQFHPVWWEEGVAEVAGEVAARLRWAADGGPALTDMLVGQHFRDAIPSGSSLTDDAQFGVLLRLLRTQEYLSSQPNSLVTRPIGADPDHSVYGSGWVFGRWIGDGIGGAGTAPLAAAPLWTELNDQGTAPGVAGLEAVTGRSWNELLDGYVLAIMQNATAAPAPAEAYTTYDFPSAIELWCFAADNPPCEGSQAGPPGPFPWPVTTNDLGEQSASFASETYSGPAGPAGLRIFDFVSNGLGAGTELHAVTPTLARMVVVRIE